MIKTSNPKFATCSEQGCQDGTLVLVGIRTNKREEADVVLIQPGDRQNTRPAQGWVMIPFCRGHAVAGAKRLIIKGSPGG